MLSDLTLDQLELAQAMSALSEQAWSAGWMEGLEFELWRAVREGPFKLGRLDLTAAQVARLAALSERCGGWIVFDAEREETFVPLAQWEAMAR